MKTVLLKSAEYFDFRGIRQEKIEFVPGENWIIEKNKNGKTSRATGFSWVVYGKDLDGNTRFDVESNNVDDPQTKVVLTLDVDGEEVVLEKSPGSWKYNTLEVKKNVFESFLTQIQSIETLEFLSNPFAFMNLHWEVRRNFLTKMFCEKVSEDSEFSFLMQSMSISDIKKSKTQQKKTANDGLKRSGIIIETHEKGIKEVFDIDFLGLKKELQEKTAEIEKLSNFDWANHSKKFYAFEGSKKDYAALVHDYKRVDAELKLVQEDTYENSKGCAQCGTKVPKEKFEELKKNRIEKLSASLKEKEGVIVKKRESNKIIKKDFDDVDSIKPDATTTEVLKALNEGVKLLNAQIVKENQIVELNKKITSEKKVLDAYAKEVLDVEAFMDRFNTFLVDNYYSSINDNFDGLFFDVEDECKCTNAEGTEFKYFSLSEKINAGVQIISVLSQNIGLKFPLWIDNRESVTDLYPIDTQIINLKVKE